MDSKTSTPKPFGVLKRKSPSHITNFELCIFCQDTQSDQTRNGSNETKRKVQDCIIQRRKYRDEGDVMLLDRLERIDNSVWNSDTPSIKWHKNCHGSFTSITNIKRIEKRFLESSAIECHLEDGDVQPSTSTSAVSRRRDVNRVDWTKCMFCQTTEKKVNLHNVQTFEKSVQIIELAKTDVVMSVRLSDVNDLIAAEGKYHLKCMIKFERNAQKSTVPVPHDAAMTRLCTQLNHGLKRGHVFDMGKVWDTYVEIAKELECEMPARYMSRRKSFYVDIEQQFGSKASFVRPPGDHSQSLLMYPGDTSDYVISHSLSKDPSSDLFASSGSESSAEESSGEEQPSIYHLEGNLFQDMVHVALRIRSDLDQTPGHDCNWRNIDQQRVEAIVPNSLYLLLVLVFGGSSVIDDINESERCIEDEDTQRRVLSIAQDIVYGVSKGRKLTPKHVGLGLTLHQSTRSENLINLFHAANHCIPIQTVRKFDNAIANRILERYKTDGYVYVPPNVVQNVFTHFSCDNIDVLEATIDGKNTFHCTQMMAWQRETGVIIPRENYDTPDNMVVDKDTMKVYQEVDKAKMPKGKRPVPIVESASIDMNNWLTEKHKKTESRLSNLVWTVGRQTNGGNKQSIPLWGSFNESSCTVKRPLTKPCMLPILAAPADEYDTIATIIKRFMGISQYVGQTHTVITADQPLYSKGKELVWANSEEFKNVIFMMGGLHVCFNFLRAIGQHMECSGLEDILLEAGVFGANTVSTVMDGKAYYRAVRGHLLTYEALWRVKWRYFEAWLADANTDRPSLQHE